MIENILERSVIAFPHPVSLEEMQELIGHVCKTLPGRSTYHSGYHMSTGVPFMGEGEFYNSRGTVDIGGMISRQDGSAFDGFMGVIQRGVDDTSKFAAFSFQTIPGYEISEYDPRVLELWDDVRTIIRQYFTSREN